MREIHAIVTRIEAADGKIITELARTDANILKIGEAMPQHLIEIQKMLRGKDASEAPSATGRQEMGRGTMRSDKGAVAAKARADSPSPSGATMGPVEIALAWARGKPEGTSATCDEMVDWARVNLGIRTTAMSLGNSIPKNPQLKPIFQKVPNTHPARWKILKEVQA